MEDEGLLVIWRYMKATSIVAPFTTQFSTVRSSYNTVLQQFQQRSSTEVSLTCKPGPFLSQFSAMKFVFDP